MLFRNLFFLIYFFILKNVVVHYYQCWGTKYIEFRIRILNFDLDPKFWPGSGSRVLGSCYKF